MLAVAVAGLNQLGAPFFVEQLFNGAMLVLAVGLAGWTQPAARAAHRRQPSVTKSPFDLSGLRILMTGAAQGIGAATAKLCASQGGELILLDRVRSRHAIDRRPRATRPTSPAAPRWSGSRPRSGRSTRWS